MARYFKLGEFACRDGTPYPAKWVGSRFPPLVALCDRIRQKWGSALAVVSGYRTPAWNRRIGGARRSQHVEGRAADLRPGRPSDARRLAEMILEMYRRDLLPELGGLGTYPTFVHVDTRRRRGKRLARWTGSRTTI